MLQTVLISNLKPNPFRRLDEYPILRLKVDALKESIDSTGFWGTIVGRPKGNSIEIAFGHHRMVALQESTKLKQVEMIVRKLSNEQMIKMMARENMEEWGSSAWVEMETVRATIDAYDKGEIELPPIGARGPRTETFQGSGKFYTHSSVATFLGWTRKQGDGIKPNFACESAFKALDLIREGLLEEGDLKGLSRAQMREQVDSQIRIRDARLEQAQQRKEAAAKAKQQGHSAQAEYLEWDAERREQWAKDDAKDFGKEAASMFRSGDGIREVRDRATERTPDSDEGKVISVHDDAIRFAKKLNNVALGDDWISERVDFLKRNIIDLDDDGARYLGDAFDRLIVRLKRLRSVFKTSSNSHELGLESTDDTESAHR